MYVKEGLTTKRISEYENINIETIFIKITISNRKITFGYRPPYNSNKATFFMELNNSLCNIARKYENILIRGYLNINFKNQEKGDTHSHLSHLCDTFSLSNLANGVICFKSENGTCIDVMLTNRPRCFHNTRLIEIGLSDCHKMVVFAIRAFFKRLASKEIECRNFKTFDHNEFL